MEIKEKITELVEKIKNDKGIAAKFAKDPAGTVKDLIGVEIPKDQLEKIVDGIKAKVNVDKIGDALGGIFGKK